MSFRPLLKAAGPGTWASHQEEEQEVPALRSALTESQVPQQPPGPCCPARRAGGDRVAVGAASSASALAVLRPRLLGWCSVAGSAPAPAPAPAWVRNLFPCLERPRASPATSPINNIRFLGLFGSTVNNQPQSCLHPGLGEGGPARGGGVGTRYSYRPFGKGWQRPWGALGAAGRGAHLPGQGAGGSRWWQQRGQLDGAGSWEATLPGVTPHPAPQDSAAPAATLTHTRTLSHHSRAAPEPDVPQMGIGAAPDPGRKLASAGGHRGARDCGWPRSAPTQDEEVWIILGLAIFLLSCDLVFGLLFWRWTPAQVKDKDLVQAASPSAQWGLPGPACPEDGAPWSVAASQPFPFSCFEAASVPTLGGPGSEAAVCAPCPAAPPHHPMGTPAPCPCGSCWESPQCCLLVFCLFPPRQEAACQEVDGR